MKSQTIRELENWRWAHSDHWLDEHLGIDQQPWAKQHQSGKAFDEPDDPPPVVDEQLAERTEAIVVHIGTVDTDIYEAMVGFWPYGRSVERVARDMGKSVTYVKSCLNAGERLYGKLRRHL
mgnify:CR=1 FL=1